MVPAAIAMMELWMSTMGDLMKTATSIQVIDVKAVKDSQVGPMVTGTVLEQWRTTTVPIGGTTTIGMGNLGFRADATPKVGDRWIVVCDSECPRAVGVEHDGVFQLTAQEPMDGAYVLPPLLAHSSIPVLAAGKPAPAICVRGTVSFLDDKSKIVLEAHVDAAKGGGTAMYGGKPIRASLGMSDHLTMTVGSTKSISLVGTTWSRAKDGCLETALTPQMPLVRSTKSFDKALTTPRGPTTIAQGSVKLGGKDHALTIAYDDYAQPILTSDLANGRPDYSSINANQTVLGFPSAKADYPKLLLTFPMATIDGLPATLATKKTMTVAVSTLDSASAKPKPIGTATLSYVPEK